MNIAKATDKDFLNIKNLHSTLYEKNSYDDFILSYGLTNGNTYVAKLNNSIIGYVSVHEVIKSQMNGSIKKLSEMLNIDPENDNNHNPLFIISLIGIVSEHKNLFGKLINKTTKYCMKNDYFKTKYIFVFVRDDDIDIQNMFMSKGFLFSNLTEDGIFDQYKSKAILMYKKVNIINKIFNR